MLTMLLALSVGTNVGLYAMHKRTSKKLNAAEKGHKMYRRLKSRLHQQISDWVRGNVCDRCGGKSGFHMVGCAVPVIQFAITRAEKN